MDTSPQDSDLLKPITRAEKHHKNTVSKKQDKKKITRIKPLPADAPAFNLEACSYHNNLFKKAPDHIHDYRWADNSLAMHVVRWDQIEQKDGTHKKEIRPFIYGTDPAGHTGWYSQFVDDPRPLYRLPQLLSRDHLDKIVLIVEGEKKAEAAQKLFPDYVVTTSAGGSNAAHKTDFSPLKGRHILISPDCGLAGEKYEEIVYKLCQEAGAKSIQQFDTQALSHFIVVKGEVVERQDPAKANYDLADAVDDGWTAEIMEQHKDQFISLYPEKQSAPHQRKEVEIGSDVEISKRVLDDLTNIYQVIIYTEGSFWYYHTTHWEDIPDHQLRRAVYRYDGACYFTPKGEESCVKLSKSRIDSVLNEMAALATEIDFFENAPEGINCANGFIEFDRQGKLTLKKHDRDHRCRHTLPGCWSLESPTWIEGSLHCRLLTGVFEGDSEDDIRDKIKLLQEVFGSSALGYGTKIIQPRAVILKGERAENGKSQILDAMRGLLPASAISTVTATRMGDERHILGLVGKLLNASDELSGSAAISSDTFKAIITGEPVSGRDVYKSRVEFRSQAQHVFAANTLPSFQGGMDRGVQRRLVVIPFNCVIPKENRIENIGKRIAEEEPDLLLAWAVEGASRLIRQRNFTIPQSSKEALSDWLFSADSVQAWFQESVVLIQQNGEYPHIKTNYAYSHYKNWAETEGYRKEQILGINGFVQRMKTMEHIHYKRKMDGAIFIGMNIKRESVVETSAPDPQNKYYETQVIQ